MTYCLGIVTKQGLVMASDSRTNAGVDQVSRFSKMRCFVRDGERVIVSLSSGNLSITQNAVNILERRAKTEDQGESYRPLGRDQPLSIDPRATQCTVEVIVALNDRDICRVN